MTKMFIDFETASAADLKKVGLRNYMKHPSTIVTHKAVAMYKGDVLNYLPPVLPDEIELVAHNVTFERLIIERFYPELSKRIKKWTCTSAIARMLRGPSPLKKATKFFGATAKDEEGATLMKRVCKLETEEPKRKNGTVLKIPFTWVKAGDCWRRGGDEIDEIMQAYCEQDVDSCRTLYYATQDRMDELGTGAILEANNTAYQMTEDANERGIRVDTRVLGLLEQVAQELYEQADMYCKEHLNGLLATQVTAIKRYCHEQGLPIDGVGAPDIIRIKQTEHARHPLIPHLEMRNKLSKSSLRKMVKLREQISDGRIHDTLLFAGAAATGRWSGRGFQPQNLPRPVGSLDNCKEYLRVYETGIKRATEFDADQYVGAIRTLLLPDEGEVMACADLSQIELRLSMYHSGTPKVNKLLEEGGDVYLDFAKSLYKNNKLTKGSPERAICKIAVLSLQYGSGARQFRDYLLTSTGTQLSEAEAEKVVSGFRSSYPGLVDNWKAWDRQMMMAAVQGVDFKVKLRSGRVLNYGKIKKREIRYANGKIDNAYAYWNGVYYKKLWGGTVYQNIIQAEARDIFMLKLAEMTNPKYKLLTTVHDEVVFSIPKNDKEFDAAWDGAATKHIEAMWPKLHISSDKTRGDCYYK